jgi:hypothetical protein
VRTTTLGVHDALRYALAVEMLNLLDHVVIVQGDRASRADGQRILITRSQNPGVGGRRRRLAFAFAGGRFDISHDLLSLSSGGDSRLAAFRASARQVGHRPQ